MRRLPGEPAGASGIPGFHDDNVPANSRIRFLIASPISRAYIKLAFRFFKGREAFIVLDFYDSHIPSPIIR